MRRGFKRRVLGPHQFFKSLFARASLMERTHMIVEGSALAKKKKVDGFKY